MNVLALSGSLRPTSTTEMALAVALRGAERAGATVTLCRLRDFDLPFCDGRQDEDTYGGDTAAFRALVAGSQALLVGSPEYHGSVAGPLKNALDLLRPVQMRDRMVGLLATAREEAGAMNTLGHLRHIFRWMNAWVLPGQVAIPKAQEAFGGQGVVVRPGLEDELDKLGAEVVRYAGLLAGSTLR